MEDKRIAFNLYYDSLEFCIIKSVISQDTPLLADILPTDKKVFLFFNVAWDFEYKENLKDWLECLNKDNITYYLLANDERQVKEFDALGYPNILVNQNCFIDYNLYKITSDIKRYEMVMNARLSPFKRHELLNKVKADILLISYEHFDVTQEYKEKVLNGRNNLILMENQTANDIVSLLNYSNIASILSYREGCCYASTEYLLCGLPVLTTPSIGGRDVWYNENNSVICNADEDSVYQAYIMMIGREWDRQKIRNEAIVLSTKHRNVFIKKIQEIFNEMGCEKINAGIHFHQHFYNKMFDYTPISYIHYVLHGHFKEEVNG